MKHLSTLLLASATFLTVAGASAAEITFDVTASDIVRTQPEGIKLMYSKAADYYSNSLFGISQGSTDGMPCTVVEGENGAFWIYAPFAGLDTQSWLRADINGDKMTIKLPQAIYADSDGETNYVYVAQKCYFEYTDPEQTEGLYYAYPDEQEIIFNRDGDTWVMQEETVTDHPLIMGLVAADDGTWCAYSDWNIRLTPFTQEPQTPPATLEASDWVLAFPDEEGNYLGGLNVKLGEDGNDVWMGGFSSSFPDAWIKGEKKDNTLTFPSKQFLGANENTSTFGYFYGADTEHIYNEEWDFWYDNMTFVDNLTLNYDEVDNRWNSEQTFLINKGTSDVSIIDSYSAPRIYKQGEVTDFTPLNPVAGFYSEPGDWAGSLYFGFPFLNKDGQLLNTDNLYYRLYVDDKPFTFYEDEYEGIPDGTEDIPFNFSNQNTLGFYGTGGLNHFIYFTFTGYDSLAIRTLYRDGNKEYLSDLVYVVGEGSGVKNITDAEQTSEEWFDLTGKRVVNPSNGIYIHRITYTDGTVRTLKTVVK